MPKNVVKLCALCGERHRFRRSWLKAAKRGGYNVCMQWRLASSGPIRVSMDGLRKAIEVVENAFFTVSPERN